MAGSDSFHAFLLEQLAPLGPVALRRMFGGAGLFCHGVMFGLVVDDALYLRADAENLGFFEAAGATPFGYLRQGRRVELSYRRVPEHLLDQPEELLVWARSAQAAAQRVAARKPHTAGRSRRN